MLSSGILEIGEERSDVEAGVSVSPLLIQFPFFLEVASITYSLAELTVCLKEEQIRRV